MIRAPEGRDNKAPEEPPQKVVRKLSSADLFKNEREIVIQHAGDDYKLRITSKNKLILTK